MGADNHPTVVPQGCKATDMHGVKNPARTLDDETLMRKFTGAYQRIVDENGDIHGGYRDLAQLWSLARELDRRDISGLAAYDKYC